MSESDVDVNLDKILGITSETEDNLPEEVEPEPVSGELVSAKNTLPVQNDPSRDIEFDYEHSRNTHKDLIEVGYEALEGILKVAKESQHPRAYEVAATMLKNMSDMTDKLMTLQEKRKQLLDDGDEPTAGQGTEINVDKAVFVGSTAELLKQLKKKEQE